MDINSSLGCKNLGNGQPSHGGHEIYHLPQSNTLNILIHAIKNEIMLMKVVELSFINIENQIAWKNT